MGRRDWLLLAVGEGLDPIRIQKAMFLFARESGAPPSEIYTFVPYNWGPFSREIYDDLEHLQRSGLIERVPVEGRSYYSYRQTSAGREQAEGLAASVSGALTTRVRQVHAEVSSLPFNDLLERIYKRYPEFATKSIFRR